MSTVVSLVVSVLPILLFLGALVLIDSYKLVALRAVLYAVAAGVVAALLAYVANVWLQGVLPVSGTHYSRYIAPFVEEGLKALYIVYLLRRAKVGFVVDAAIYGFAIGAGFAVLENLYYVTVNPDAAIWSWFVRGFGTALMHGGCTSIAAMVAKMMFDRSEAFLTRGLLFGLGSAVVLHSLYNHFLLQPLIGTGIIVLVFPWVALGVFEHSEKVTRAWLGSGFDVDQELLRAMKAGKMSDTPVGKYLRTLRSKYSPEVLVDMMCLLRLRAELGIKAKGILMMREAGFDPEPDPNVKATFDELAYLEKSIGRIGMLSLHPFLHASTKDLWQLTILDEARS